MNVTLFENRVVAGLIKLRYYQDGHYINIIDVFIRRGKLETGTKRQFPMKTKDRNWGEGHTSQGKPRIGGYHWKPVDRQGRESFSEVQKEQPAKLFTLNF